MATRLAELDQVFEPGLTLTVLGREYVVPLPSAALGVWCQRVATLASDAHNATTDEEVAAVAERMQNLPKLDDRDLTLAQRLLGPVHDQMVADRVPHPYVEFCGRTAYVWVIGDEERAADYWNSGGRPEALRPGNRAQRRAEAKAGGTSTAAARTTKRQASTSGTKSRSRSAKSAPVKASRGKKSSNTGA